ncbi:MAG: tetratricopeptide repeat protein [Anaerolineae bacterium]|nr:tetratricopeptide repeat protein [Anaerolineae bacterium]
MGRITSYLIRSFRSWDRSSQIALLVALALLVITFFALVYGPLTLRQPALIGFLGLLFGTQIIFMWANRGMVTPYTQAQRRYLAEDFEGARQLLEELQAADKADVSALTLLANTYRQLGMLEESERVVKKAIEIRPFDHFSLYGFGRTLLVMGRYAEAAEAITQALEAGAPPIVRLDLGESLYRMGNLDDARMALEMVHQIEQESFRALMTEYLLYRVGAGGRPLRPLIEAGLPYWRATLKRFQHTPYGQSLVADVQDMQTLLEAQ